MDLVTSNFLKSKAADTSSDTFQLRSHTGGRPINVSVGKSSTSPAQQLTSEEVKVMQIEANLSDNQVGKIMKNLRLKLGRKVVQPGLRENMISEKTKFESYFMADEMPFTESTRTP